MSLFDTSFELAMALFLSIWNGLLFIILATKLSKTKEENRYFSKKIIFSALINFGGWCTAYMIHAIIRLHHLIDLELNEFSIMIMYSIFTLTFSISFVSSYIFVISMIYAAFDGSEFAMKHWILYSHVLLTFILFILCNIGTFFVYVIPNKWGPILHFILYLLYIFGLCCMYYLLNMNLIKMVMLGNDRSRIYIFNPVQSSFMSTVTKLSVLQGIFTFTATFYLVITVINNIIFHNSISNIVEWLCYAFTVIVGTLSIYLTFNMNLTEYKCICKPCNICCKKFCESLVKWLYLTNIMKTEIKTIRNRTRVLSVPSHSTTMTTPTGSSDSRHSIIKLKAPSTGNININAKTEPMPMPMQMQMKMELNTISEEVNGNVSPHSNENGNTFNKGNSEYPDPAVETPQTPLMMNNQELVASSVYNMSAISEINEENHGDTNIQMHTVKTVDESPKTPLMLSNQNISSSVYKVK
eukprot:102122_1